MRLVKGWESGNTDPSPSDEIAIEWMRSRISDTICEMDCCLEQYRISEAMMKLYSLIWSDFCSWYLEIIKPPKDSGISRSVLLETTGFFEDLMVLLHPFMPFVTEEVWHQLRHRKEGEDCIVASLPEKQEINKEAVASMDNLRSLVTRVREVRNKYGISFSEKLNILVEAESEKIPGGFSEGHCMILEKFAKVEPLKSVSNHPEGWMCFLSGNQKYFVDAGKYIDLDSERERLEKEKKQAEGFLISVEKKLSNKRFVDNAPGDVVEREQNKLRDGRERLRIITESLDELGKFN